MNLPTIKKVVMAALMLPTIVMALEAAFLIAYSYRDLSSLEATRQHATLLTMAGEIASSAAPEEAEATTIYIERPDPTALDALFKARTHLDQQAELLNALIQQSLLDASLTTEFASLQARMANLQHFRMRVDQGGAEPREVLDAYRPLSAAYLDLVNALDEQINDNRLLRKLDQLQTMLHGHEAGLIISALGDQYLAGGQLTQQEHETLVRSIHVYESRLEELADFESMERPSVLQFHNSDGGRQFQDVVTRIKARDTTLGDLSTPSQEVSDLWVRLHVERMDAWKEDLDRHIRDTRDLADTLTQQSRIHFIGLVTGVTFLLLLTTAVVMLATKGIRLVDRLIRDREALVSELRSASQTDTLTGMHNRRGFEAAVRALQDRRDGRQSVNSVVIFDLDRFKLVNDVHGHDGGDAVLMHVARVARGTFRSFDLMARHGGEEFVVLLPGTTLEEAATAAEHVRLAIAETDIRLATGTTIRVTASFGCASHDGALETVQLNETIKKADLALYAAKFSGRNKVVREGDFNEISMERREVRFA